MRLVMTPMIAAIFLATSATADTITLKAGRPLSEIEIVKVTYKAVSWRNKSGASGDFSLDKVDALEFENTPVAYTNGEAAMGERRYEDAIKQFREAQASRDGSVWIYQYSTWKIAECQIALGQYDKALATLQELLAKQPETRFLADALVESGRILLDSGQIEKANASFKRLAELASGADANLDKSYFFVATAWQGRAALAGNNVVEAKSLFDKVKNRREYPEVVKLGVLGYAQCELLDKRYKEARRSFEQYIEQADRDRDEVGLAVAYNGIGESYIEEQDYEQALRAFLKVVVLFDEVINELPKALYYASRCFDQLKTGNREFGLRSQQLRGELRSRFPNSPWAKK